MNTEIIAIGRASQILGVSPSTLRNWDKQGLLKPIKSVCKHRRYLMSDVKNILNIQIKML